MRIRRIASWISQTLRTTLPIKKMKKVTVDFPGFIKNFPQVQFPPQVKGNSSLISCPEGQVVFHTLAKGQGVPPHTHDDSWAVLVSGSLEYTLGGEVFTLTAGESWFIGNGVVHGGTALEDSLMVEVFCEQRWQASR